MRATVYHGIGDIRLEEREIPTARAGEVLLRVRSAGICMTDAHILQGHFPVLPPRILGHELSGIVENTGQQVDPAWTGTAVGVAPARFCGRCWRCLHGAEHLCAEFRCLGNTDDGGFAEYVTVPFWQLVRLDDMTFDRAVWMEPLACVLHAIAVADPPDNGTVLISGCGTLGQLAVRALKLRPSLRTAVVDPNADKVDAAARAGAEVGWTVARQGSDPAVASALRAWAGNSLSAVIEMSGKPIALERAIAWATARTRIVLFGVADSGAHAALPLGELLAKEIVLTATAGMTNATFADADRLLGDNRLDTDGLVKRIIGLDELPSLLSDMTSGSTGKVLVILFSRINRRRSINNSTATPRKVRNDVQQIRTHKS